MAGQLPTELDLADLTPEQGRALLRSSQAGLERNSQLAMLAQLSGDPTFQGLGHLMSQEGVAAQRALERTASEKQGHDVQKAVLDNQENHARAMELLGLYNAKQRGEYDAARLQIAQTKAAGGGMPGARAVAALMKNGKPANIPGIVAQLYPVAQLSRTQIAAGKVGGAIGTSEDPSMTWNTFTEGLLQEMGNVSHGSASESAVEGFRRSRPDAFSSPLKKTQWLREVSVWGRHQSETVNALARNLGLPMGAVPEEVMQGWEQMDNQLFGIPMKSQPVPGAPAAAPPAAPRGLPRSAPAPAPGPVPPAAAPPAAAPPAAAPPAAPPEQVAPPSATAAAPGPANPPQARMSFPPGTRYFHSKARNQTKVVLPDGSEHVLDGLIQP